jgi:8-oxo-dGTP diphosphatase
MTLSSTHELSEDWVDQQVDLRISVDPALFTLMHSKLHVLLRRRSWEPFKGVLALPGSINPAGEQIEETMWRELRKLGFSRELWVEQLKTFDRPAQRVGGVTVPGRDPRGRVISVTYFATLPADVAAARRQIDDFDGAEVGWFPLDDLPELAFDHDEIVRYALWRLRNKIQYAPVAFELLPEQFTLTNLQDVYEAVLGTKLDKRNFRRKVLAGKVVVPTNGISRREKRPAKLYRSSDCAFEYSPRAIRRSQDAFSSPPDAVSSV